MKTTLFAILSAITLSSFAHTNNPLLSERLKHSVYVVLSSDNTAYNEALKLAVETYWSVSDYAFITHEEFKGLKKTSENMFIMLLEDESVDGSSIPFKEVLEVFYMVRNGSYRYNVTGIPLANLTAESAPSDLTNGIRLLQDKLSYKIASESGEGEFASFEDEVESRTGIVKTKKLYIAQEDLDAKLASIDAIQSIYSGEVIIVSKEELTKIIQTKSDLAYINISTFKSGLTYTTHKRVIDASSGMVLYTDEVKNVKPVAFNKTDFDNLQK